jgi:hypothetical protein
MSDHTVSVIILWTWTLGPIPVFGLLVWLDSRRPNGIYAKMRREAQERSNR